MDTVSVDTVAIITFDPGQEEYDLGKIKEGLHIALEYNFTNTGKVPLDIELVTACKCAELDWTRGKIMPGEKGVINVLYDSRGEKLNRSIKKDITIIANTEPIVTLAYFTVYVEPKVD